MKKYEVTVYYNGAINYNIKAKNEREAKQKAENLFNKETKINITNGIIGNEIAVDEIINRLPSRVTVNINDLDYDPEVDNLDDVLSDWLSDTFEFCHYGFDYETDHISGDITIFDIEWDTTE